MYDIVITEFMDQAPLKAIEKKYSLLYDPTLVDNRDKLLTLLNQARAIIVRNRTLVNVELLDQAPALEVVGRLGVGLDNIDLAACENRQIKVCPATGANDDAVAEWVISTILQLFRNAYHGRQKILSGDWPRDQMIGREIQGKVLGLIGYGGIARATAVRARALGMLVIAYDPYQPDDPAAWKNVERANDLLALLQKADAVSLHVPLTTDTKHLIGKTELTAMKKDAVLVNAARGGVLDEKALSASLTAGELAGAALDVFETEPLTAESGSHFHGIDKLILTPHIAGVTYESNQRVSKLTIENIVEILESDQ